MLPTTSLEFVLDDFESLKNEFEYFPRGVLMTISINPFTGKVLVATQSTKECSKLLRSIFKQIKTIMQPKRFKPVHVSKLFEEVA